MGGSGSGNRSQCGKTTVEECLTLSMGEFRKVLVSGQFFAGTITWSVGGDIRASIGFSVAWEELAPIVTLRYRWKGIDLDDSIRLEATYPTGGGVRWWFICPLTVAVGVQCNRRVGKLFMPPGERWFGCRHCFNLTYESTRRSGMMKRWLAAFAKLR